MRARNNRKAIRRVALPALAISLLAGVNVTSASASELISVSSDELLIAEPGTRTNLAEVSIDAAQVGQICSLTVLSQNQASIHDGNNLIVTTGDLETVIADVEAEADAETDLSTEIMLGPIVTVELEMGPDWVSSLGFSLSLDCDSEEPALVTTEPPTCTDTSSDDSVVIDDQAETETAVGTENLEDGSTECETPVEPEPLPIEIAVVPVTIDRPTCPDPTDASMTIAPVECPEPAVQNPLPEPSTPAPEPEPTTPAPASDTKADPEPEVLGVKTERLPQAAPAVAIPKTPNYNG